MKNTKKIKFIMLLGLVFFCKEINTQQGCIELIKIDSKSFNVKMFRMKCCSFELSLHSLIQK